MEDWKNVRELIELWSIPEPNSGCWIWLGDIINSGTNRQRPYGRLTGHGYKEVLAHRLSYESYKGKIPKPLEIHHICNVPLCVNPDHLEITTHKQNISFSLRDTCKFGHPLSDDNLMPRLAGYRSGERRCRICYIRRADLYRNKKRKRLYEAHNQFSYNGLLGFGA